MKRGFPVIALLLSGCGLLPLNQRVLIRPGCQIKVVDDVTGFPIADVRVTIVTVSGLSDTAGVWHYTTDETGIVGIASERANRRTQAHAGRKGGPYEFRAAFEADGYQYYSQRIAQGYHVVRLSRGYLIALG